MGRQTILIAIVFWVFLNPTWAQPLSASAAEDALLREKISEFRENGKYKRITETFAGDERIRVKREISSKDNGSFDYVFLKLFRDGSMIFASTFDGAAGRTMRSYYRQGKLVLGEEDEDGDGNFETMILFDEDEQPLEAFRRTKKGDVRAFSKNKLAELKESFSRFKTTP